MDADPELLDHLALASVPGLGPVLTAAIVKHFGSASAARSASAHRLESVPGIGRKLAQKFAAALAAAQPQRDWQRCRELGLTIRLRGRPGYPPLLDTIEDAPMLLYLRGEESPADQQAVALVGSRECSAAGWKAAEQIAAGLARAGWTVVSGLARGIDAAAHKGALAAGGRTIAVTAGGLDRIYPPEHWELAAAIARSGLLMTETPPGVTLQAGMFPARNRIVSGLCQATVVVEAGAKSGALITIRHALEQGREAMAVPGAIDNPHAAGGVQLLRDGARLVRSAEDILEDLQGLRSTPTPRRSERTHPELPFPLAPPVSTIPPKPHAVPVSQGSEPRSPSPPPAPQRTLPPLSGLALQVWETLATASVTDEIAQTLGRTAAELSPTLLRLEMTGRIRRLPGGRIERIG